MILSNRVWRQQFAADPKIVGRDIRLNGEPYKVVGVLPSGQPDRHPAQILAPLAFKPEQINHDFHWLLIIGRLYESFAALALLLAAVGIYGVMAFAVSQRIHEIGVRMALGARRAQVFALILREGVILALVGVVVGLAGAYLVGKAMQSTLYGVGAIDPIVFSAVSFVLLLAALLACIFPARNASKVDPIVALRQE